MKHLGRALCALAFTACAVSTPDQPETQPSAAPQVENVSRAGAASADDDENCTITQTACRVGQCELGPHDTYVRITEVCCDASGSCTTENYKLCGC